MTHRISWQRLFRLSVLFLCIALCNSWNEWKYKTTWSTNAENAEIQARVWNSTWFNKLYNGDDSPPRPRKGHSLHIIKTDSRSDYKGETYIVMFGGRDNDQLSTHIPKTYNVKLVSI